jgi:hypothetical protein
VRQAGTCKGIQAESRWPSRRGPHHRRAASRWCRAGGSPQPLPRARHGPQPYSKSSVSLWVRDLPCPERFNYVHNERRHEGLRRYSESRAALRAGERAAENEAAAAEIGELTHRDLVIAGAIAYWCEGTKNKPDRKSDRVAFINSDPGLIIFFLRFLGAAGVNRDDLVLRVYIHENADAEAAQRFWLELTGVQPSQFRSPTLKRHNPKTHRTNVGENYHGCLRIDVRRSGTLYWRIEGWASGIMSGFALSAA